jgi:trehalose 6-phosphate synthase/phosphatase
MIRPFLPVEWKARVLPVLEHFTDRTPGSFVEEKEFSLVWHHRMADPEFGEWLANELISNLDEMLAETELHPVRAQKSIEVKLAWANKGAARFLDKVPGAAFRLGIGDDRTGRRSRGHLLGGEKKEPASADAGSIGEAVAGEAP